MKTIGELRKYMESLDDYDDDTPVRVVFHGWEKQSFNLPCTAFSGPSFGVGMNIVCEEPRDSHLYVKGTTIA